MHSTAQFTYHQVNYNHVVGPLSEWLYTFTPESFRKRIPVEGKRCECVRANCTIGIEVLFATHHIKHQTEGVDCGAYVVYYAIRIMQRTAIKDMQKDKEATPHNMENKVRPFLRDVLAPFLKTDDSVEDDILEAISGTDVDPLLFTTPKK